MIVFQKFIKRTKKQKSCSISIRNYKISHKSLYIIAFHITYCWQEIIYSLENLVKKL